MANPTKAERRESWKKRTSETASALKKAGATVKWSPGGKTTRTVPLSATVVKPGEKESEIVKAEKAGKLPELVESYKTPPGVTSERIGDSNVYKVMYKDQTQYAYVTGEGDVRYTDSLHRAQAHEGFRKEHEPTHRELARGAMKSFQHKVDAEGRLPDKYIEAGVQAGTLKRVDTPPKVSAFAGLLGGPVRDRVDTYVPSPYKPGTQPEDAFYGDTRARMEPQVHEMFLRELRELDTVIGERREKADIALSKYVPDISPETFTDIAAITERISLSERLYGPLGYIPSVFKTYTDPEHTEEEKRLGKAFHEKYTEFKEEPVTTVRDLGVEAAELVVGGAVVGGVTKVGLMGTKWGLGIAAKKVPPLVPDVSFKLPSVLTKLREGVTKKYGKKFGKPEPEVFKLRPFTKQSIEMMQYGGLEAGVGAGFVGIMGHDIITTPKEELPHKVFEYGFGLYGASKGFGLPEKVISRARTIGKTPIDPATIIAPEVFTGKKSYEFSKPGETLPEYLARFQKEMLPSEIGRTPTLTERMTPRGKERYEAGLDIMAGLKSEPPIVHRPLPQVENIPTKAHSTVESWIKHERATLYGSTVQATQLPSGRVPGDIDVAVGGNTRLAATRLYNQLKPILGASVKREGNTILIKQRSGKWETAVDVHPMSGITGPFRGQEPQPTTVIEGIIQKRISEQMLRKGSMAAKPVDPHKTPSKRIRKDYEDFIAIAEQLSKTGLEKSKLKGDIAKIQRYTEGLKTLEVYKLKAFEEAGIILKAHPGAKPIAWRAIGGKYAEPEAVAIGFGPRDLPKKLSKFPDLPPLQSTDVPAAYFSPSSLSPHFLRLATKQKTDVEFAKTPWLLKIFGTTGAVLPTAIRTEGLGVKRIPKEYRKDITSMKEFFAEGKTEPGYFYTSPKTEYGLATGRPVEVETVLPFETLMKLTGKKHYMELEGVRVPIRQYSALEAIHQKIEIQKKPGRSMIEDTTASLFPESLKVTKVDPTKKYDIIKKAKTEKLTKIGERLSKIEERYEPYRTPVVGILKPTGVLSFPKESYEEPPYPKGKGVLPKEDYYKETIPRDTYSIIPPVKEYTFIPPLDEYVIPPSDSEYIVPPTKDDYYYPPTPSDKEIPPIISDPFSPSRTRRGKPKRFKFDFEPTIPRRKKVKGKKGYLEREHLIGDPLKILAGIGGVSGPGSVAINEMYQDYKKSTSKKVKQSGSMFISNKPGKLSSGFISDENPMFGGILPKPIRNPHMKASKRKKQQIDMSDWL